jgi:hypothetical protein
MSIEIKAKTTRQVIDEGLRTEDWDLKGYYKEKELETADFEKPMWVSLEEAEKLESKLSEVREVVKIMSEHDITGKSNIFEIKRLQGMLSETNTICEEKKP